MTRKGLIVEIPERVDAVRTYKSTESGREWQRVAEIPEIVQRVSESVREYRKYSTERLPSPPLFIVRVGFSEEAVFPSNTDTPLRGQKKTNPGIKALNFSNRTYPIERAMSTTGVEIGGLEGVLCHCHCLCCPSVHVRCPFVRTLSLSLPVSAICGGLQGGVNVLGKIAVTSEDRGIASETR